MAFYRVSNGGTDLSLGAGVTGVNSGGSTGTVTYTITNAAASGAKELGFTCNRASNTSYSVSGATIKARATGGLGSVFILKNLTNSIQLVAWNPGTSDPGYGYYFIAK